MKPTGTLWVHGLTPLHNGAGQGLGTIDRPIIRERATQLPFIQASTLKGALRAAGEALKDSKNDPLVRAAFGEEARGVADSGSQGIFGFTDGHLLCFPVASLASVFAWVTSPYLLERYARLQKLLGNSIDSLAFEIAKLATALGRLDAGEACHGKGQVGGVDWGGGDMLISGGHFVLEQLVLENRKDVSTQDAVGCVAQELSKRLWPDDPRAQLFFCQHLVLVSDSDFQLFHTAATQIEANIKVSAAGTVDGRTLRYSEYLPSETILYSAVSIDPSILKAIQPVASAGVAPEAALDEQKCTEFLGECSAATWQLGGDETKGRGLCALRLAGAGS